MQQLQIHFPLFSPDTFGEVKKMYAQAAEDEKQKQIEHLKHVIAGFKAYRTRRKKTKKK